MLNIVGPGGGNREKSGVAAATAPRTKRSRLVIINSFLLDEFFLIKHSKPGITCVIQRLGSCMLQAALLRGEKRQG